MTSKFWMQMVKKWMALMSFWGKRRFHFALCYFDGCECANRCLLSDLRECLLKSVSWISWLYIAYQHFVVAWLRVLFLILTWFHAFFNSSTYDYYKSCRVFMNIIFVSNHINHPKDFWNEMYWQKEYRKASTNNWKL